MTKIKVSELFYSLQGEGLYTGTPSIFLRTFGCNFKCRGFGMKPGELSDEYLKVDPTKYEKYDDLPLVHTGCDSYAAWDPRFKKLSPTKTVEEIVDELQELLPNGKFGDVHLIFTGGEPLLGWQNAYIDLIDEINFRDMDLGYITFETNGTQFLSEKFKMYLRDISKIVEVTFSISSKLPCSGEAFEDAIKPEVIKQYIEYTSGKTNYYFKWVVSTQDDIEDVKRAIQVYRSGKVKLPVYLMPVGGTVESYQLNESQVAEYALKNGYRFSQRLQINLYGNKWGT